MTYLHHFEYDIVEKSSHSGWKEYVFGSYLVQLPNSFL